VERLVLAGEQAVVTPEAVLRFWFEELDPKQWFRSNPALDQEMRFRLGDAVDRAAAGEFDSWAATPDGALSLVLLLDQLPRNIHRSTARAFAQDAKARQVAKAALARGFDRAVAPPRRTFFYLPLEHSEDLADQERSVALFTALGDEVQLDYARRHRDVIARFGRFPHRNALIGRESTEAEIEFLADRDEPF
jgi:uncharacterized protein (DUF924 family)